MPPSSLCWHQTHTWDTDILAGKILEHIKREGLFKKKKMTTRNSPQREEKQKWWGGKGWGGQEGDKLKRNQDVSEWQSPGVTYPSYEWLLVFVPIFTLISALRLVFHKPSPSILYPTVPLPFPLKSSLHCSGLTRSDEVPSSQGLTYPEGGSCFDG